MSILTEPLSYNAIQTFFVDASAVNFASEAFITSIDLFFKLKPDRINNSSGVVEPGVVISLCEVINNSPDLTRLVDNSTIRVEWDQISTFTNASVPTTFTFPAPIPVKTGDQYAIIIKFEALGYELWINRQGHRLVGTNTPSQGATSIGGGNYYLNTSSDGRLTPLADTSAVFRIRVAKFTSNSLTIEVVNKNYEFLTLTNRSGAFKGGEYVYQVTANQTGTVAMTPANSTVVGSGTTFTSLSKGQKVVFKDGSNSSVHTISDITNNTIMTVDPLPYLSNTAAQFSLPAVGRVYTSNALNDTVILVDSNANTTVKFAANDGLVGEISRATANISAVTDFSVDQLVPKFFYTSPVGANVTMSYTLAYSNGSQYITTVNNERPLNINQINEIKEYDAFIRSRSNEVDSNYLYGTDKKSALSRVVISINKSDSALYESPFFTGDYLDVYAVQNKISNSISSSTSSNNYAVTFTDAGDLVNRAAHGLQNNTAIIFTNISNTAGISPGPTYFVVNTTANTFQIATSVGGSAQVLTNDGSGVYVLDYQYDSEVDKNGTSTSKHISKKMAFANNQFAEDLKIYVKGYRPQTTEIRVYAKIHNSADPETFDDKSWTPLVITENGGKYSSSVNSNDLIDYTYSLPDYSEASSTLAGTFAIANNSAVLDYAGGTLSGEVSAGDIVRIYDPGNANNWSVAVVSSANSSSVTLTANSEINVSGGKLDILKYPHIAFADVQNYGISRYFNTTSAPYDKYDSVQIKVVLTANTTYIVPSVSRLEVVGVSV